MDQREDPPSPSTRGSSRFHSKCAPPPARPPRRRDNELPLTVDYLPGTEENVKKVEKDRLDAHALLSPDSEGRLYQEDRTRREMEDLERVENEKVKGRIVKEIFDTWIPIEKGVKNKKEPLKVVALDATENVAGHRVEREKQVKIHLNLLHQLYKAKMMRICELNENDVPRLKQLETELHKEFQDQVTEIKRLGKDSTISYFDFVNNLVIAQERVVRETEEETVLIEKAREERRVGDMSALMDNLISESHNEELIQKKKDDEKLIETSDNGNSKKEGLSTLGGETKGTMGATEQPPEGRQSLIGDISCRSMDTNTPDRSILRVTPRDVPLSVILPHERRLSVPGNMINFHDQISNDFPTVSTARSSSSLSPKSLSGLLKSRFICRMPFPSGSPRVSLASTSELGDSSLVKDDSLDVSTLSAVQAPPSILDRVPILSPLVEMDSPVLSYVTCADSMELVDVTMPSSILDDVESLDCTLCSSTASDTTLTPDSVSTASPFNSTTFTTARTIENVLEKKLEMEHSRESMAVHVTEAVSHIWKFINKDVVNVIESMKGMFVEDEEGDIEGDEKVLKRIRNSNRQLVWTVSLELARDLYFPDLAVLPSGLRLPDEIIPPRAKRAPKTKEALEVAVLAAICGSSNELPKRVHNENVSAEYTMAYSQLYTEQWFDSVKERREVVDILLQM